LQVSRPQNAGHISGDLHGLQVAIDARPGTLNDAAIKQTGLAACQRMSEHAAMCLVGQLLCVTCQCEYSYGGPYAKCMQILLCNNCAPKRL